MVSGQVFNQTAISYRPGRSARWYLSQAGGMTQLADRGAVFVVRGDGSVLAAKNNSGWWAGDPLRASLRPGDSIVVPEKPPRSGPATGRRPCRQLRLRPLSLSPLPTSSRNEDESAKWGQVAVLAVRLDCGQSDAGEPAFCAAQQTQTQGGNRGDAKNPPRSRKKAQDPTDARPWGKLTRASAGLARISCWTRSTSGLVRPVFDSRTRNGWCRWRVSRRDFL